MTLTAQVESFRERLGELKELLPAHYDRLSTHKAHGIALDPQYDIYFAREAAGELVFVTLREDGRMVGYWIAFVAPGLHYKACLTAIGDIWFVVPKHLNGTAPLRLGRAVERELKRRGVRLWFAGEKLHFPCGRLYQALGMEPQECTWAKWLEN